MIAVLWPQPNARSVRQPEPAAGEADHGRGDKEIVRAVRCHAEAGWLHRHVGSDRRCQPGCGAASAQYGRREEGDQGGPYTAELEGQAGQAAAQGSRCALDGQIQQGQTAPGWLNAASRWQSRCLAIRTMSRSIAVSASSADGRPQMRLPMRAVVCAKACSTAAIRGAGCGPIRPTDRRPTRRS